MSSQSQAVLKPRVAEHPSGAAPHSIPEPSLLRASPGFGGYAGIFLTCASVLLFELALTRIFSVLLWAHLAFMVVGTALFGFGLSGVYLALRTPRPVASMRSRLGELSLLLTVTMLACYLVVSKVPFEMWNFQENPINYLYLGIWYVALVVPFFVAGLIVAQLLSAYPLHNSKLYGTDLIGAAAGSLLLIPLIPNLGAEGIVVLSAMLAALAGLAYTPARDRMRRALLLLAIAGLALLLPKAPSVLKLTPHQDKRRFNTAAAYGHIYETRWSPLSRVDIAYHKNDILDIWIDGGTNESAILKWNGDLSTTQPLNWSTIGLAYDLKRGTEPNVMIIGPAGGKEVLFALSHGASHVDAVEMDPSIVALVNEPRYAEFMGRLYQHPKVTLHNDEGRSFLRRQPEGVYDVIQSVNNYTPVAMNAGALNLSAAFLLTKEALHDYLNHLTPNGVLALHRGAALRIAIAASEVLGERGIQDPGAHLLVTS
ncbi:MAG: hypothetical protein KDD69_04025, partial [Bdellovibrionales bacterium]|nr:hypothetical protein [Bdellovibrionales bacterium]